MTPAARLSAAIEVLDDIVAGAPAERVLTRWARARRFAGSKDRAAIRDHVYDVLRRRASSLWASGAEAETGRALIIGLLVQDRIEDLDLFGDQPHAPAPLTQAERDALRPDLSAAPLAVRGDFPAFLEDELVRSLGDDLPAALDALRHRAPVDLRVNLLKADVATAQAALAADDVGTEPLGDVPGGLRVVTNARRVGQTAAYRDGLVELQDAASQLVARAVAPQPGMRVLDLCAGGGGKALALAALMGGQGRVMAHDINPARMRDLPQRAARAGASITVLDPAGLAAQSQKFDRVLVDAPCSGTGAWRRNPDHKWRLDPAELSDLVDLQARILDQARGLVRPGGRLVYATCSILRIENEAQSAAFAARFSDVIPGSERRMVPGDIGDGFYHSDFSIR